MKREREEHKKVHYFDYSLVAIVIFLLCFGLIMLYSASSYSAQVENGNSMHYLFRQAFFSAVGFCGMIIISKIDYHRFAKWAKWAYIFSFIAMALVLTPLGKEVNHSRRWIRLPFKQSMQPSEFAKIAVIIFIPALLCYAAKKLDDKYAYIKVFSAGVGAFLGVFILTDNLSTAIIVLGISCVMIFIAHPKTARFFGLGALGVVLVAVAVKIIEEYTKRREEYNFRLNRILVWLHPEQHLDNGGYQVMQGLYAVGSGGFFGKGLGNSAQKMVIPEAQNDMILAIICEELGVFGVIVLFTMFGILLHRLLYIAKHAPDRYGFLMVTGIFAHVALQVVLNVAVVLNVIPTTGITLPFVSYGGTSTLFLMVEMGIALSVSNRIEFDVPEET